MLKLIIWQKNSSLLEYPLDKEKFIIGRASENDVVLNDVSVSRKHAQINVNDDKFEILDLGSKNGVYLNGEKIDRSVFNPGDEVAIGDSILKILGDSVVNHSGN